MSKRFFFHLVYLFIAVTLTWVWTNHPTLSFYNLQLIAALIIVWFIKTRLSLRKKSLADQSIDASIFTIVVLLLVFSTGGAGSPLFFLLYFLLFGLSFLFEPVITITLVFTLFTFLAPTVKTVNEVASLLSLFLITPLALFFGQIHLKNLVAEKKIKFYKKSWLKGEDHLEKQETNTLMWLSLKLKPGLEEVLDKVSQLMADIGHLTPIQKTHLKRIRRISNKLLKGGERLLELIDWETDKD